MSDVFFILVLSLAVIYCDFRGTKHNWGALFNGVGCIPAVLKGESMAPMQYRVLVPWICALFGEGDKKPKYLIPYLGLRWIAITAALGCAHWCYYGNIAHTTLLALFFIIAALFDYTDIYIEVALLAVFIMSLYSGHWWLLMLVVLFGVLNRETALVMPFIALLSGQWGLTILLSIAALIGLLLPRAYYGRVDRYTELNMIPENIERIVQHYKDRPVPYVEYTLFFVLCVLMVIAYIVGDWTPVSVATGLLFVALLIPTMWREIRVFAPSVMVMIPMVLS